jgi:hypothetical protein
MTIVSSISVAGVVAAPVNNTEKRSDEVDCEDIVGVQEEANSSDEHGSDVYVSQVSTIVIIAALGMCRHTVESEGNLVDLRESESPPEVRVRDV